MKISVALTAGWVISLMAKVGQFLVAIDRPFASTSRHLPPVGRAR